MWAEQSPTRSDPEGSSRNEFASGHAGLSPVALARAAAGAGGRARRPPGLMGPRRLSGRTLAMPEAKDTLPYRVLARKYRPVDFTTLVGQEAMVRTLRNAIATGRIAHAFMLTGVRGVGKTTTARIIARALNCIGKDGKGGADGRSLRRLRQLQGDHRGPPCRRDRDGRGLAHRHRRRARADRGRALPPGVGALQGLHHRRSAHAVGEGVQRACSRRWKSRRRM